MLSLSFMLGARGEKEGGVACVTFHLPDGRHAGPHLFPVKIRRV